MTAGVHYGFLLSPLLFIIVLEALSHKFCSGAPWEVPYADHIGVITESLKESFDIEKGEEGVEGKCT